MSTSQNEQRRAEALHSLRRARGRYTAERASQLSGIPKSTMYEWQRAGVYVPDFGTANPMAWSYRDLVFLRVFAWLRNELKTARPEAAKRVRLLKNHLAAGKDVAALRADRKTFIVSGDPAAPLDGPGVLFLDMLRPFDLTSAVSDFGRAARLWGPDLVVPSLHTYISPWVLGGDPCIDQTRIPTASIFALREERGLDVGDIVQLFPGLDRAAAQDGLTLEGRLRGVEHLAAA